jgi:hypothetical protein
MGDRSLESAGSETSPAPRAVAFSRAAANVAGVRDMAAIVAANLCSFLAGEAMWGVW